MRNRRSGIPQHWLADLIPGCLVLTLGSMAAGSGSAAFAAAEPAAPLASAAASPRGTMIAPVRAASAATSVKLAIKPRWQDLSAAQQQSLKPLAANWSGLSEAQRRKWLAIAEGYPKLSSVEQATLHSRMTEWAGLSQSQRAQARMNFADTKQVDAGQKAANWQAYQALSADEKKKLLVAAPQRPSGATATVRPVQPQRLATVPVTRPNLKQGSKMAAANSMVDPNTLLPQTPSMADPAGSQKH